MAVAKRLLAEVLLAEVVVAVIRPKQPMSRTGNSKPLSEPFQAVAPVETCEFAKLEPLASASMALNALTAAALALPGLMSQAQAVEQEQASFQYGHYEESKRHTYGVQSNLKPIQVDTLQGGGQVSVTDRLKFAFNYTQDTWGGATPVATAPLVFGGNHVNTESGASPYLSIGTVRLDAQLNPLKQDPNTGKYSPNTQLVHTLAMASPETRKQGDFKFAYEWDEAALDVGGGVSSEHDYESRFGNVLGRFDFNQKLTSLMVGLSYTNSDINSILDHDATPYIYDTSTGLKTYNETHSNSQIDVVGGPQVNNKLLTGNREDWATNLSVTQVLNKNALLVGSFGFTRNTGYLANPYKAVTTVFIDPKQTQQITPTTILSGTSLSMLEVRPDERNQWIGNLSYVQHIDALNGAALHGDYRFYTDDWGITSHTFEVDWAQPVVDGWTVTPMLRYYTQNAADFYQPYLVSFQDYPGRRTFDPKTRKVTVAVLNPSLLPTNFSSDQRLSGYGAISTGITVSKRFVKGITLEAGAEYYTHAGSLKMGGDGEGSYADFNYYRFNAGVNVDLSAVTMASFGNAKSGEHAGHGDHAGHEAHQHHGVHGPAGVMFDHMLAKSGDFMLGYRYMWGSQNGDMLHGKDLVDDKEIVDNGCYGDPCYVTPTSMYMNMHMLDLMYAPLDWLTLMLMPQFVDMNMDMRPLEGAPSIADASPGTSAAVMHAFHTHQTGGLGDVGMYALFRLFEKSGHHIHATFGISAPTGDVGIDLRNTHGITLGFIHYGMQLGSGTWDFKPSLTYTGQINKWSWGAQLSGTHRLEDQNSSGFAFGDILQATAWGGFDILDWLTASVRGAFITQGALKGAYNSTYYPIGPMDYANSYGGRYWDVGFGINAMVPTGNLQGTRLSFEWIQPVYDDVNGYQLQRTGSLAANWSYGF